MRILSITMLLLVGLTAHAQRYGSYNYIGRLQGGSHAKGFLFETVHGIHFKSSYAGVGAGIDDYGIQSVPVFVNFTQKFFREKLIFVSFNAGGHLVPNHNEMFDEEGRNRFVFSYEPSIGYLLKIKNKEQGVLFSGGYSFKHIRTRTINSPLFPMPFEGNDYNMYDYKYNRIALKIGFLF